MKHQKDRIKCKNYIMLVPQPPDELTEVLAGNFENINLKKYIDIHVVSINSQTKFSNIQSFLRVNTAKEHLTLKVLSYI